MSSSKIVGILAMVATACFLIVVVLQSVELLHYSGDPSIWPVTR